MFNGMQDKAAYSTLILEILDYAHLVWALLHNEVTVTTDLMTVTTIFMFSSILYCVFSRRNI